MKVVRLTVGFWGGRDAVGSVLDRITANRTMAHRARVTCRYQPVDSTLIVLHAYGEAQPWALLTDTPVAQTEPTLYACRNWIKQGFRDLKTVGWKWHRTRRLDPVRVGRHWLALALLRGGLWACMWLRPTPGPDFSVRRRRLHPGGT